MNFRHLVASVFLAAAAFPATASETRNEVVKFERMKPHNHGPATFQLFDTRTGRQEGGVMAYELANGGPNWAAGMAD